MSVLDVANDVAAVVGVTQLTSLFATSVQPRTQFELRALLNDMGQRIAYDTREWTALKKVHTIYGDGVAEGFNLPLDYQRMLLTTQLYPAATPTQPLVFISDTNDWVQRRLAGTTDGRGEWTLLGGQILLHPIPEMAAQFKFAYLGKNFVNTTNPAFAPVHNQFTLDTDTFRLPERLLKLGSIWEWKKNKGSPYAEDMGTYQDAIMMAMGADKPAPIIAGRFPITPEAPVIVATITS